MTVYHGSTLEIQKPDVIHSKTYLDFGKGFYVTTFLGQAERWALRKSMRLEKGTPIVNVYDLADDLQGYHVRTFRDPQDDEEWIDFVCDCRDGKTEYRRYDIIIGSVADDDVFKSVDMYHRGIWDKQRTLQELKNYKKNNQIALISQAAVDHLLMFKYSYEVERKP